MKRIFVSTVLLILACQMAPGQNVSTTSKTTSKILLEQVLSKDDLNNNMVRMETVEFPPGYSSAKHIHPCPLFAYVLEGELLSEFEGITKLYHAGDTFYENATGLHSVMRNDSNVQTAKILVVYLMTPGMETYIPKER